VTTSRAGVPPIVRGRIYGAVVEGGTGEKYYLAVSNNQRNRTLPSFLAVRLTTSRKPDLDTIVALEQEDAPWVGRVVTDDILTILQEQVTREAGALRPVTMRRVDAALRAALGLR
jgi:mRNA interferase MazF